MLEKETGKEHFLLVIDHSSQNRASTFMVASFQPTNYHMKQTIVSSNRVRVCVSVACLIKERKKYANEGKGPENN